MRTTALCALGAIIVTPTLANASLIGLHLQVEAVDGHIVMGGVPVDTLPGSTTWRLYAEFDDPNDQLTSVGGSPGSGGVIIGDPNLGFYQNQYGGSFSTAINPAIYGVFPSLAFDSWVTIGAEDNIDNYLVNTGVDATSFDAGGNLYVPNGNWGLAMNDPNAFGDVLPGMSNYQVLVGQFTVWGYGASTAPWGHLNLSGFSTSFMPGGELVEWSVDGVTFGVPAPGALALLGLAGVVRRRRRAG